MFWSCDPKGVGQWSGDLQGWEVVLTVSVVRWYVLDAETTDLVAIHTDGNEQLSVMRFSQGEFSPLVAQLPAG